MVRLTGAVALLLAASTKAASGFKPNTIPGAYIFEFEDSEVPEVELHGRASLGH